MRGWFRTFRTRTTDAHGCVPWPLWPVDRRSGIRFNVPEADGESLPTGESLDLLTHDGSYVVVREDPAELRLVGDRDRGPGFAGRQSEMAAKLRLRLRLIGVDDLLRGLESPGSSLIHATHAAPPAITRSGRLNWRSSNRKGSERNRRTFAP